MKAAIFSLGSKSSKWTAEAMRKYFEEVDEINIKNVDVILGTESVVLNDGKEIGEYDCIFVKGSFRFASLLRSITEAKYAHAYMPLKAASFTIGHNKLLSQLKMQHAKVPMPKTYVTASIQASKKILEAMNYPVIMKFPSGTQGKGVMLADSFSSAASMLDAMEALNQPLIIQEYVETDGSDIRALVVGDEVVAAYKRKAVKGEKRSNIHAGGSGEKVEIDRITKKVAVLAAKSVGAEVCGVDILEGPKGPLVIEANLSPGLQGITDTTGIDVADKIAAYLYAQTKERKQQIHESKTPELAKKIADTQKEATAKIKSVIDHVKIRAEKIVLPSFITKITDFDDEHEVEITAEKGRVIIKDMKK